MEIQALNVPSATFSAYQEPIREANETTWKTHVLVVLSYFLIGIGIALACASVYMATVVHPMVAMATPVVPLAAGILLWASATSSNKGLLSANRAPVYIKGQPLGLINHTLTECFLNSALQVLNHASTYKEMMKEIDKESDTLAQQSVRKLLPYFGLFPLITVFKNSQAELEEENRRPISSVNSTELRKWLSRVKPEIPASGTQEDPMALFEELHSRSGKYLPLMQQKNDEKPLSKADFYIPLLMQPNAKNSFQELFNGYFSEYVSDSKIQLKKWFSSAPSGFLVQAKRFAWKPDGTRVKVKDPMGFPMDLELTKKQCPEGTRSYSPDVFIVHHGSSTSGGHYTAYIFRNGYWWHGNDASITQVSNAQAAKALKDAYIVHYAQQTEAA